MNTQIPCTYVSVWDDTTAIATSARYDPATGEVTDIEVAPLSDEMLESLEVLTRQYIRVGSEEYDVQQTEDGAYLAVRTFEVFFSRNGYAQVEAASAEEAMRIADKTLKYGDISWDDDWHQPMRSPKTLFCRLSNLQREEYRMSNKRFTLLPNGDEALFYSGSESESRCIGHLRIDLGGGDEFWSSWQPHAADGCNDDETFKRELDGLAGQLRKSLFKSRARMYKYIAEHPALLLEDGSLRYYGYSVRTNRYEYYIRCTPECGNYSYIYCYLREGDANVDVYERRNRP